MNRGSVRLDADLQTWAIVWIVVAIYLVLRHWRSGQGVGLLLAYVISLGSIHWIGAVIYLLPWYYQKGGELVAEGMKQSAFAVLALAAGAEIVGWMSSHRGEEHREAQWPASADPFVVNMYLITGVVMYAVMIPLAARIATIGALVSTGSTVAVVGLALKCWNGWHDRRPRVLMAWLCVSALLPFVTVATQGYLGYGMGAMATVCAFVASFYGPRWKTVCVGILMGFVGLSVYVTYMRDRSELRQAIRTGSSFGARASRVTSTLSNFEWFNLYDPAHLYRIDDRLNQDFLVGAAVAYLEGGSVPYAHGSTLAQAALAIVPRALWPGKTMSAGSGDLVATYTGMTFAQATSVGIGQIMECYVNFGTAGVIFGFMALGALLKLIDLSALRAIFAGNVQHFTLWYLPGLGLLQVGGSFVDVTTVSAAGFVVGLLLNGATNHFARRREEAEAAALPPVDPDQPSTWR